MLLCWPPRLCGLTGLQWRLGPGGALSCLWLPSQSPPGHPSIFPTTQTPDTGGYPREGVGPPQALTASLLPLPGPGRVTGAHRCLFPLRSPCHSLSSDILWRYCWWTWFPVSLSTLTHSISVLLRACISGEVMSSCNAESVERPLSHFSKHCLFQSRKLRLVTHLCFLSSFFLSATLPVFRDSMFRILPDQVRSLSPWIHTVLWSPSRNEPGAHALQWGERGSGPGSGVTADPLHWPRPKILSLDKWLFKPIFSKVLSRHTLKVPSS